MGGFFPYREAKKNNISSISKYLNSGDQSSHFKSKYLTYALF